MPQLRIHELHRSGITPVSFTVTDNSTLCLYGQSGSGKTLLLRAIADIDPNHGEVWLDNKERNRFSPEHWRQQVCYIPAESRWWHERVAPHSQQWEINHLRALGFEEDVLSWTTSRLSSGEKQRLAIARALNIKPKALLLDEPTANLDTDNAAKVESLLVDYQNKHQCPVIWVSHNAEQRSRIASQSLQIHAGRLLDE